MDSLGEEKMKATNLDELFVYSTEGNLSLSTILDLNSTSKFENGSFLNSSSQYDLIKIHEGLLFTILTSTFLGALTLLTALGNLFVMTAIWMDRNLQTVQNYLIFSLAFADFMVACTVMPMGALYEVMGEWTLGTLLCDFWTSADVLCCTASILHLVAIALDRYWSVTSIDYMHKRSPLRILTLIGIVWILAIAVSIPPIFGWKDPEFEHRVKVEKRCLLSQDVAYQVFATVATFYAPLFIILLLYWRIYQVARKRICNKPGSKPSVVHATTCGPERRNFNGTSVSMIETRQIDDPAEDSEALNLNIQGSSLSMGTPTPDRGGGEGVNAEVGRKTGGESSKPVDIERVTKGKKKDQKENKKEGKTRKVLAIITGIFIVCWLPFFVNALYMPFCVQCQSDISVSIFLWLGYANSLLNPVIYTIFSPDFRHAFRKIFGVKSNRRA